MNRKGEVKVGMIIIVAITLIVGIIFFRVIAQQVGETTNTWAIENQSLGAVTNITVGGTPLYMTNCRAMSGVIVFNATENVAVPSTNYSVANNVVYNGALAVAVSPEADFDLGYNTGIWTIDGTCQPTTYIADSGGRAIAKLIAIFFALAVLVVALVPTLRNEFMELVR